MFLPVVSSLWRCWRRTGEDLRDTLADEFGDEDDEDDDEEEEGWQVSQW